MMKGMMRTTVVSPEPELVRLCRSKTWVTVSLRSRSHPKEATPTEASLRGEGNGTVLSVAVRCGAPCHVLASLLQANRHQIGIVHKSRGTILHEALKHRVADDVIKYLLQMMIQYQETVAITPKPQPQQLPQRYFYHERHGATRATAAGPCMPMSSKKKNPSSLQPPEFFHISVQEGCMLAGPNLLTVQDDTGRTALHYLVEHAKLRMAESNNDSAKRFNTTFHLFGLLLTAIPPESINILDSDGNSPLLLLLSAPRRQRQTVTTPFNENNKSAAESLIDRMVDHLVTTSPKAVSVSRKLPRPWRFYPLTPNSNNRRNCNCNCNRNPLANKSKTGHPPSIYALGGSGNNSSGCNGAPTPLSMALLNGRSVKTVRSLLLAHTRLRKTNGHVAGGDDNDDSDSAGSFSSLPLLSPAIVSQYHETCLHIAVTTRAPLHILYPVLMDDPRAILIPDVYGLTPVDWLWIRHVLDWYVSPLDFVSPSRVVTRRRFLADSFLHWHNYVSQQIPFQFHQRKSRNNPASEEPLNKGDSHKLQEDLLHNMKVILPVAADVTFAMTTIENNSDHNSVFQQRDHSAWSLLHSACFVNCPVAMIRVVLALDQDAAAKALRSRDGHTKRLPLHYAAARAGYAANLPVGISRRVEILQETSPVLEVLSRFPAACRATDSQGQLPLHIAIDTAKFQRNTAKRKNGNNDTNSIAEGHQNVVLGHLLSHAPDSLERRDGKTRLYPWQQAAAGSGACLDSIYYLLRRQPVLICGNRLQSRRPASVLFE